jgi:ABC-type phosphate transport system permease subunit
MSPAKTQPALLGGVVIGVLSALPVINLANCCCAWILFGGALAAYLMQQNHPEPIVVGDGAIVGLLAGVIGAVVWVIASVPIGLALAPFQSEMAREAMRNATDISPELRAFMERFAGAPTIGLGLFLGFFVMLVVSTLFGMLGGLFGALMFRTTQPPVVPPPIPPDAFKP